jgi:hypothetical protein
MSRTGIAFLGIALVISLGQWLSMRVAGHVDMRLLPGHTRRRVQWWLANSRHIQLVCAIVAVAAITMQITRTIG